MANKKIKQTRKNLLQNKPLHPYDKEILRALLGTDVKVTPAQIAKVIGIHPQTVKFRIEILNSKGLINCEKKGNRTYCKINREEVIKFLKNNNL
jgi:predicted ArsR family transcriptional regulator